MGLQEIEGPADAGEHAQRQHVHLDEAQSLQVVLVPFDDRAVRHGGVLDGHDLLQRMAGDDERSEEHTSELQSLMLISYAVFCLKKQNIHKTTIIKVSYR